MFRQLGDHRDSKERMEMCIAKAEESRKESLYFRAIREKGKGTSTGYIGAIPLFEAISGYKDADEQLLECKKHLNWPQEINNKPTQAADRAVQEKRKYDEQIAQQKQKEEEERIAKQKLKEDEKRIAQKKEEDDRKLRQERRNAGLCQHCGGRLKGLFAKKCVSCGKPKDY